MMMIWQRQEVNSFFPYVCEFQFELPLSPQDRSNEVAVLEFSSPNDSAYSIGCQFETVLIPALCHCVLERTIIERMLQRTAAQKDRIVQ